MPDVWNTVAERGARQFSNWNRTLFEQYCEKVVSPMVADEPVLAANVAETIREGIGCGYLTTAIASPPANLMEHCLRNWLPEHLKHQPAKRRATTLAKTWNLLEGLLREPAWVNAYVLARVRELTVQTQLEEFLIRVLTPLFEPAGVADWNGPYHVTTLSLRSCHNDFLPGDLHLVAPTVLAIQDRRNDLACGVILRKSGQSELVGEFGKTQPFHEPAPTMTPRWNQSELRIGKETIPLPLFPGAFRWIQTRSGFVVASTINSQKLWIVESET